MARGLALEQSQPEYVVATREKKKKERVRQEKENWNNTKVGEPLYGVLLDQH